MGHAPKLPPMPAAPAPPPTPAQVYSKPKATTPNLGGTFLTQGMGSANMGTVNTSGKKTVFGG